MEGVSSQPRSKTVYHLNSDQKLEMVVDHPIAILARTRSDKFGEVLSSGIEESACLLDFKW